ncbi:MAG: CZB domain-containing protein [Gammaproteobacteria bacterium]|nr:CZB domain-containing protein [Gammaproteobacteria bacterium]MDJ0870150.1 CZB domain-containing protein [Gammaproteobacteria bacterium]MDJ0891878.1 CZB domain-containing protein [Gammaproteobacteria bacterium]
MSKSDFAKGALSDTALDGEAASLIDRAVSSLDQKEVAGLDFKGAIDAHMKWKGRLNRYCAGTSSEALDAGVVAQDDQCVLGKWIYGEGLASYGGEQLFKELKAVHARFHASAGQIVAEVDKGNPALAQDLLNKGDYPKLSRDITHLLAQLFVRFKGR